MRFSPSLCTVACLALPFPGIPGEAPGPQRIPPSPPSEISELQRLHGTWEGGAVGDGRAERITITVAGNSLRFHRDTNFWFETTITLPPHTFPQQMHATIRRAPPSQAESIGTVVGAISKVEGGTWILVTKGGGADEVPGSFEADAEPGVTRYEFRKIPPPAQAPLPTPHSPAK